MKPYLIISLLVIAGVAIIAAIVSTDNYCSGAAMIVFASSFFGASLLFFNELEKDGNK